MNKVNYQKELEKELQRLESVPAQMPKKRLLLHACCAPCSSYCLEYLQPYFDITVLYYNPNITEREEYEKRVAELHRLTGILNEKPENALLIPIKVLEGRYEPERFFQMAKGMEELPEGGARCFGCYAMRLEETACIAREEGFDYFTTTLTISPLKNADKLNEIGKALALKYDTAFLPSDFKKKNGYKRSVELSEEYGLYRQNYCGCVYSVR